MSTAKERLQTAVTSLRSSLANERTFYNTYKNKLELFYPGEWKIYSAAIVAVAQYYNGEIVRAKHDLADWMNGHEVHGTYADSDAVTEIHDLGPQLLELLEDAGKKALRYNERKQDPISAAEYKVEYDEAAGEVGACLDLIVDLTKALEEITYAER